MKVPFLDLEAHHRPHRAEFQDAMNRVIDAGAFAGGSYVAAFEEEFATYCDSAYAVGVGSGTEALWIAMLAMGVGPGDEVITSPASFMATAEAITYCGATPVFVDIDEETYNLDPKQLERALTAKTRAIVPVHLFGQPADMAAILDFAQANRLLVVEDAAQAHGAAYGGRRIGSFGDAAGFSFYPGKNLGAFGEAGAVTTSDEDLAKRMRMFRDHGQVEKYYHDVVGWNGRMDGIQAAILSIKLRYLDTCNALRRRYAQEYRERISAMPHASEVVLPVEADGVDHVYHLFAVRVPERDRVLERMKDLGIACGIHYPIPIHLQHAYSGLGYGRGAFPIAEKCAEQFLSLPMFPEMTTEQIGAVVEALNEGLAAVTAV
ncbi:MAG: DegT/DnrJ/EryC1/StrS family aminotransferase [Verrucomicrobiae bacterium]|nr:DegT/DnrJ/EryC1/StrS family aminotransferase [Verrucomicrobiae bacterium]